MPDPAMAINITGNDADAARMIARQQRDIDKLKGAYRDLAKQGKETGDSLHIGSGVFGEIAALGAGYLSVGKALEVVTTAHEAWRSVLKETTELTRSALDSMEGLAALQAGGGGGAMRAAMSGVLQLAKEFGITDQRAVPELTRGLQAAMGGNLEAALRETKEILAVEQVTKAPLGALGELGQLAAQKRMDPGQLVREVAMAAQETALDAETIMRGARSMGAFGSGAEWVATQAVLSKQLGPRGATAVAELPGLFMEGAPKEFTAWLKKHGVAKGTPMMEALGKLREGGFTTVPSLEKSGLPLATRELLAMSAEAQPRIVSLRDRLPGMATEEEIERRHQAMIREVPEFEVAERARRLAIGTRQERAFGPQAPPMSAEDEELFVKGQALTRMGMTRGILGGRLVDPEGRMQTGFWAAFERWVSHLEGPSTLIPAAQGEYRDVDRWRDVMKVVREELQEGTKNLNDAATKFRGGAAMVLAGEDR